MIDRIAGFIGMLGFFSLFALGFIALTQWMIR